MEHLSNDHEDHPNQLENSHKPRDETAHPVLSLLESQRKDSHGKFLFVQCFSVSVQIIKRHHPQISL